MRSILEFDTIIKEIERTYVLGAFELSALYEIRCQYLHSSSLNNLEADALRCVRGAYAFLKQIIGFPEHLFAINGGAVECLDTDNPLFKVFYASSIRDEGNETISGVGAA